MTDFKDRWELNNFFSEKSAQEELLQLKEALKTLKDHPLPLDQLVDTLEQHDATFKELESYIVCLLSEDTNNKNANSLFSQLMDVNQYLEDCFTLFENELKTHPLPNIPELQFYLKEKQQWAHLKLSKEKEEIINALQADGHHGFATMYDHLKNHISVPSYESKEPLSYPEAENRLNDPNRLVRRHMHNALMEAFKKQEDLFCEVLNHISGFRLKVYELRGWKDFLDEPLQLNRISKKTLECMYTAIDHNLAPIKQYFKTKAKSLKVEQLSWYDVEAPIFENETSYTFDEGCALILEAFGHYSPKLQEFARTALASNWVEGEERKNKRAGGFCTSFPKGKETRIFMNYKDTFDNVLTLAHELGHSFHAHVTFDLPLFNQNYPMNLAETASTMCEQMVLDFLLKKARNGSEKANLLDKKMGRHATYVMNLASRFYFEQEFYKERTKGFVAPAQLTELMVSAQKKGVWR